MANSTYLILRGGLGNQIFQYVAAHSCTNEGKIYIESGFPDKNFPRDVQSEIFKNNAKTILIESKRLKTFTSRFIDKCFGVSAKDSKSVWFRFVRHFLEIIGSIYFSFYYMKIIRTQISQGVGFSRIKKSRCNIMLIGYFQSYVFHSSLERRLNVFGNPEMKVVRGFYELSTIEKPLIVHQRFGDYLGQDSFGVTGEKYLEQGMEYLFTKRKFGSIWLFSDDLDVARKRIPVKYDSMIRVIDDTNFSPLEILEIMSFGSGFLIANSSFSWWSATLSRDPEAPVVAPSPWFRAHEDPKFLIPNSWIRFNAEFENQDKI
jgi:hypothetical protein